MKNIVRKRKLRRLVRTRSVIRGSASRPRISVFRSNKYIYAQAIDDEHKQTICCFSSFSLKKTQGKETKEKESLLVGQGLAKILKQKNISIGVFDRGSYAYIGRVKALCEGVRQGGVKI